MSTVEFLREAYKKIGTTLQPLPIIVGLNLNEITASYVFINEIDYKVESPVRAIDVAFKSFHALHASYPSNGKGMWWLLQKCVYKIETQWDEQLIAVRFLENTLMCD